MKRSWITKSKPVSSLHLDPKNPRLGRETTSRAPREIIQHLFEHDKAVDIAQSIATRGYFPNEPLLAIEDGGQLMVVEGNRRLAALKALKEPGLLEGKYQRQVERLSRQIEDMKSISSVPVTIAPSRRATDRQIAGRHVGTPVLAWQAENRASFILEKLAEGYTNDQLRDQLGFTLTDIQTARQTRAIADMARSLDLPDEVRAKLEAPNAKVFSTVERVLDSKVGRDFLFVEPDAEHGIRGNTTSGEFLKGFTRLVTDIVLKRQSSRSLNTIENIERYLQAWPEVEKPKKKRGSFVPSDIVKGRTISSIRKTVAKPPKARSKPDQRTVLPSSLKVRNGNSRLVDIRKELVKLKRDEFPNAGAVLLRVFFELTVLHYLEQTGRLASLKEDLKKKKVLQHDTPTLRQLSPIITNLAKEKLSKVEAKIVEKAVRYDASAPFTLSELNTFVHQPDLPSARDIEQFWNRIEPLVRLMLENSAEGENC